MRSTMQVGHDALAEDETIIDLARFDGGQPPSKPVVISRYSESTTRGTQLGALRHLEYIAREQAQASAVVSAPSYTGPGTGDQLAAPYTQRPPNRLRPDHGNLLVRRGARHSGKHHKAGEYPVPAARSNSREPVRDWSVGMVTGHRLDVVLYMIVGIVGLYRLQSLLWHAGHPAHGAAGEAWSWGSLLWLNALVPGLMGMAGLLFYRHPAGLDEVRPIRRLVCWRIVSRGTNTDALIATIQRCRLEMRAAPMFPYLIEVVTDMPNPLLPAPARDLAYITVPPSYQTPNGSLFKARALQYALGASPLANDAWIVHLDEETHPTTSGIKGIARMIAEEESSGRLRVGQGAILYHRNWRTHPFLTLADMVRTGDDFARFHFAHRVGVTIFGLHGSYIVVRNDVEKAVGFDFGPQGSITEDAFWALVCMQAGRRCRWVDGYLEEQSTQSILDFLKQRRRWFQGLVKVSLHAPVKFRWRAAIGLNTLLWALAPFTLLYTIGHLVYGAPTTPWIRAMANVSFAAFATLYLIGVKANLDERGIWSSWRRAGWTFLQAALLPVFTLMEGAAVMLALVRPGAGFHVVKK